MSDLVEFLLARLDEDERVAGFANPEGAARTEAVNRSPACYSGDVLIVGRISAARVLAEVAAKRRIVDAYLAERVRRDAFQAVGARAVEDDAQATRRRSSAARCRGLEIAVEFLALPHAEHPDFRKEWNLS